MLLTFFMDGVKYDMMQEHMPFLASLNTRPIISEFGYSCACHATMYTGRYIDEHDTWFIWQKGENSPYKWIDKVPLLKYMNILPLKLLLGKVTNKVYTKSGKITAYSGVPCLVNLPLKYWSKFELADKVMWNNPTWKAEKTKSLFNILRENNIEHEIIALHNRTQADDAFIESQRITEERLRELDYIYYFIGYTDNMMHSHGEEKESAEYLRKVDNFIKSEYERVKKVSDKRVEIIAFSDHGHITLDTSENALININDYFKYQGKNVNNYINLIESNFARFWFRNDTERQEVEEVLHKLEHKGLGFIINKDIKDKYHLNVDESRHGEMIFYLDAPREFTNTIWGFGHSVKSGHGYLPTHPKHFGIFCSTREIKEEVEKVSLLDILPTTLNTLKLNGQIKQLELRGKELWQ